MGRGDKPGQDEWSQGRKAAGEARGYAPSPRGGSKPVNLGAVRGANAFKAVWRPGYGWMPAYRVGTAGQLTAAARAVDAGAGSGQRQALRSTNASAMGPLSLGGGGGGGRNSNKTK